MTKRIKSIISKIITPVALLVTPVMVHAQADITSGLSRIRSPFAFGGRLTNSTNAIDFIANIISLMLFFAGAIAVLFIIIGGYRYITSGGNEETAETGKKTVINAIIGLVIIILAYVIINAITRTFSGSLY